MALRPEEMISEPQGMAIETIQNKTWRERKKQNESISELGDNFRWLNIWVIKVPEGGLGTETNI